MSVVSVCAYAQAEGQIAIGYSGREVSKSSEWGLDNPGQISAAIKITPDLLKHLTGVRVCGVSVGLASRLNIDDLKVWVRNSLDGENLVEAVGNPKKGWNDIVFDAPLALEGEECYVGYTLNLEDASYPVSVVEGESEYGFFLNMGDGWFVPEVSTSSVLSLLAVIDAENLPQYDLAIEKVCVPSRMKIGASSPVEILLANKGCRTVTGANLRFIENGKESDIFNVGCALAPGEKGSAIIDYTPIGTSRLNGCQLKIAIESLNEGADDNMDGNECLAEFNLCKYDFLKRIFLEEFTTQQCSNCPRAAEMIHEVLALPQYKDRIAVCTRHSGFGTDIFTSKLDEEMLVFYGGEGTYCPGMMLDRTPFYSNGVPVMSVPGDMSDFISLVNRCLEKEASVDFSAVCEYDASIGKLRVKVSGGREAKFGATPARLSVYLVENDIFDTRQKGAVGNYYQQHVVRAYDSIWGAIIDWDADDEFSYECLLDPSKVDAPDNTEVVAVIHDYDAGNISNCIVNNAYSTSDINWGDFSGVESVSCGVSGDIKTEYYDLQGRRLYSVDGVKGVVLKKTARRDGTVVSEKVML